MGHHCWSTKNFQEQTKELNKRLEKLKFWINSEQQTKTITQNKEIDITQNNILTVSSFQKAVNDSINYDEKKEDLHFYYKILNKIKIFI